MKTVQEELAKCPDIDAGWTRSPSDEDRAREALDWAIDETVLKIPPHIKDPYGWEWDTDDVSLRALTDDGEFRFHIAAEQRGSRKVRIAVLSVSDDHGTVTWESEIKMETDQ